MSQDIHQRIEDLGNGVDFSDASTYAEVLGYDLNQNDGTTQAQTGDTTQAGQTAAATDGQATANVDGAQTAGTAQVESSATPNAAGASEQSNPGPVDGIATRDGKRIIPYAVLESERRANLALKEQLAKANEQLQALASKETSGNDLAERASSSPESLTDAELEELERDFPSLAKPLQLIRSMNEKLAQLSQTTTQQAPAQQAATAQPADQAELTEQEAYDQGIADNPLIATWMSKGGKEWERACAIDEVLQKDPSNKGLTYSERFAKVQRMVAAEFGIDTPPSGGSTQQASQTAASSAATKPGALPTPTETTPTLTDLSGRGVSTSRDPLSDMTTGQMVDRAMSMSEDELRALAGIPV